MKLSSKKICIILVVVSLLALVPIIIISFYSHAQIDDYYYGIKTYHAVQNGTSVFKAAVEQVKETYNDWQGTYSAVFLFSLHPAILGENFYFLTTFILLVSLIGATFFFSYALLKKYFKASTIAYITITTALLLTQIELVPSPVQGFFWFNGSIYYTFFYSLALTLFSLLLIYLKTERMPTKIACMVFSLIIAAIMGGGNFVTALCSVFILFLGICCLVYKKDKRVFGIIGIFAVFLVGFIISIKAPGNAVRQSSYNSHTGAVLSIIYSFFFSASAIFEYTTVPVILFALLIFPLLSKTAKASGLKFDHPFIFSAATYVVFTTQFTPTVYAWGGIGEQRIMNIIFYSYLIMIAADLFYFGGYLARKTNFEPQKAIDFVKTKKNFACIVALCIIVVAFTAIDDKKYNGSGLTTSSAVYSLLSGEAQQYDKENNERLAVLKNKEITDVEFQPFSEKPHCLFYGDLTQDPDYMWSNKPMKQYFDKDSVIVDFD